MLKLDAEVGVDKSSTELKEQINKALASLKPAPPEGAKVQEVNKLRKGGVIIQLATKEAVDWL